MSVKNPLLSMFAKSAFLLTAITAMFGLSINANAGFLDSIYEAQSTISSIGRTADSIRGSKQSVSDLSEDMGFTDLVNQNNQSNQTNKEKPISGSILSGKLQSTKLYSQANKSSSPIAILSQQDIMIYMGTEQNGYYHVESDKGEGWVSKPLVSIQ